MTDKELRRGYTMCDRPWRERLALWIAPTLREEIYGLRRAYEWVRTSLDATRDV